MQRAEEFKTGLSKIPNDWQLIHLNEIVDINPETIGKNYPFQDIEYIDIGSVENYQIKKYESFKISNRPSRAQRIVRKNDIIVSMVRPYLHGFTKIVNSKPSLICSTGFAVLRSKDLAIVDFIFNFIKSQYFESQISAYMTGLAYPAVSSKIVGNTILASPKNKDEIKQIGIILSNVDELIQKTDQIIEQTQKLKKCLMQRLLTKGIAHAKFKKTQLGEIPEEWNIFKLEEVCSIRKNKNPKSQLYIGLEHIGQGNNQLISKGDIKDFTSNKNAFLKGDVLYGKLRPLLNKVYLTEEDGYCSTDILPLSVNDKLSNKILLWTLTSERFVNYADSNSSGTKMPRTNWNDIKNYLVPFGRMKEQQKITCILSNLDELMQKQQDNKLHLDNLKKGLMQQLLTGKLRVKG